MGIRGDLVSLPLWEVLQLLSSGRKTGKFQVEDGERKAEVFFKEGRIVYAKTGLLENMDALLDLALWNKGNFIFFPEEKSSFYTLDIDPFEVLIGAAKYIDLMDYLGEVILLPVKIEDLSLEEEVVCSSFDGLKTVREVAYESSLGKVKTLELVKKLIKEERLLRINEDFSLFWLYIFWRYWLHALKEFPKIAITERNLRREWQNFLNKKEEKVKEIFRDITSQEKVSWHYFYRHLKEFTPDSIEKFSREAINFLFSLGRTRIDMVLDAAKIFEFINFIENNLNHIFLFVGKYENFEEEFFSWFFDGEKTFKQIIDESIFERSRTQSILGKLLRDKKIVSFEEDKKLALIFTFWRFWMEIYNRFKGLNISQKLEESWQDYIENNVQEVKYIFENLVGNLKPYWPYFYKNLGKYTEEEIKGFIKNSANIIRKVGEENLESQVLDNIWKESLNVLRKFPIFESIELLYEREKGKI
ncbi:MAG: DUF4388 domain-containing protein [Dictyoglomus sp.]|nr:DUF4388 domain-containing protein [Dictyoglomus sp.]MCX7941561.1 DUF4388 domain-containing protein [Dictyoglomaceae bacterium]MDW8187820.1 DUF4388 domain-containing protein [Dictyoglomus sp.]